jgi:hypothetical protein
MRSFSEVSSSVRETTLVISAGVTFIFLLILGVTVPTILRRGFLLSSSFIIGFILFGVIGFFAFEIINKLDFLGNGVKYGVAGFFLLLIIGALFGGNSVLALVSGSISGFTIFYAKSMYSTYNIFMIETQETEENLVVSELEPLGNSYHYMIKGLGSNFELLNYMIEALSEGNEILYYARHTPEETLLEKYTRETVGFFANHISPIHKVRSRDRTKVIKQIAIEASYLDTMERALLNYWLRAYLSGGYTSVVVPFGEDFLEKAAICERSYGGELEIETILGDSSFLLLMEPLSPRKSVIKVYTRWTIEELMEKIETVHPVAQSDSVISL